MIRGVMVFCAHWTCWELAIVGDFNFLNMCLKNLFEHCLNIGTDSGTSYSINAVARYYLPLGARCHPCSPKTILQTSPALPAKTPQYVAKFTPLDFWQWFLERNLILLKRGLGGDIKSCASCATNTHCRSFDWHRDFLIEPLTLEDLTWSPHNNMSPKYH